MKNDYYTYAYLREGGTPYYIGKGRGKRAFDKWGRNVRVPSKDRILFLKTNLTEQEAFKHEIYMIALYGRKDLGTGILWNFTDGGEGTSGIVFTEEACRKISESKKGKNRPPHSEEHRRKLSEAGMGKKKSVESIEKGNRKRRKPVEIVYPSGKVGVFNSRKLALLFVPFSLDTLCRLLRGESSKFTKRGYSARYLPVEATK